MKQHKINILIVSALLLFLPLSRPTIADEQANPTVSFWLKGFTQYIGPQGAVWHPKSLIQGETKVIWPGEKVSPYIKIWQSFGLDDSDLSSNDADETDYTVGLRFLADLLGTDVNVDAGVNVFDTYDLLKLTKSDIYNPYIEFSKDFDVAKGQTLSPYLKFSPYFPMYGDTPEKGLYILGGVKHVWQFSPELIVRQKAGFVRDEGALDLDSGYLAEYQLSIDNQLTDSLTWNVLILKVYTPLTVHDRRETDMAAGTGIKYKFPKRKPDFYDLVSGRKDK
jgi:hypothetical protein